MWRTVGVEGALIYGSPQVKGVIPLNIYFYGFILQPESLLNIQFVLCEDHLWVKKGWSEWKFSELSVWT